MMIVCKQIQAPVMQLPISNGGMDLSVLRCRPQKEKVVVVMGATGTGKSRLSIDIATRFTAEIINSDKIQLYEGLDIVTNKISEDECVGVPHHLLGIVDPESDFTSANFASTALLAMKSIVGRGKLPIIAGGSNSFIEALVDDENYEFRSRYDVCFLWVDVAMLVLHRFVSDRVDRMVAAGMVEEVRNMYNPDADYSKGIRRAIGKKGRDADEAWAELVAGPAAVIVNEFLYSFDHSRAFAATAEGGGRVIREAEMGAAMAAATH
ncbi:tRNA isopentenyltransferase [Cynara cardunculus var. scolymus]|uniref:tRNA isopentenyltransferase n=1 Tax=Cynara cardunculus var. scolymus TaxID=59895 RepID=A0A103YNV3_CYNCS|nr:tRNA isopentenyltransferase [Cynara cardunculus var. scolymus]